MTTGSHCFSKIESNQVWLKNESWMKKIKNWKFHVLAGKLILRWPDLAQVASVATGQVYEIPVSGTLWGLISD